MSKFNMGDIVQVTDPTDEHGHLYCKYGYVWTVFPHSYEVQIDDEDVEIFFDEDELSQAGESYFEDYDEPDYDN